MKVRVSVIIPVKEINDYIRKETIPALLKQTNKDFEVIILSDKASSERFPKTKIIPTFPKTGPADKRDIGAKVAKGGILAFLDDDSYPAESWLESALSIFDSDEGNKISGVCGPTLTPPNDSLRRKVSGAVWSSWLGSGGAGTYRCAVSKRREVDDYPSVNLLVRKKDFWAVGGFDSHFWPGEDTKLCLDLTKRLGKKIIYDPDILVYHHRREVFGQHIAQISRYAIHRGYFARVLPSTSFRVGYFLPTFFVLGFLLGPLLSLLLVVAGYQIAANLVLTVYLTVIVLYILALLFTSLQYFIKEKNFFMSLLLIPSIFATHFIYGVLFFRGFFMRRLVK